MATAETLGGENISLTMNGPDGLSSFSSILAGVSSEAVNDTHDLTVEDSGFVTGSSIPHFHA